MRSSRLPGDWAAMRRRVASLAAAIVSGACSAISPASSRVRPGSASAGCTSSTSPIAFASAASTRRAVRTSSRARTGPTVATRSARLVGATKLPSVRATGAPKRAWGAARRRSHASAMNMPPPTASPWTIAIVGLVSAAIPESTRLRRASYPSASSRVLKVRNWRMSVPLANARSPAPRSTTTRTPGSRSRRSQVSWSASYISKVIALRASGRLMVTTAPTLPLLSSPGSESSPRSRSRRYRSARAARARTREANAPLHDRRLPGVPLALQPRPADPGGARGGPDPARAQVRDAGVRPPLLQRGRAGGLRGQRVRLPGGRPLHAPHLLVPRGVLRRPRGAGALRRRAPPEHPGGGLPVRDHGGPDGGPPGPQGHRARHGRGLRPPPLPQRRRLPGAAEHGHALRALRPAATLDRHDADHAPLRHPRPRRRRAPGPLRHDDDRGEPREPPRLPGRGARVLRHLLVPLLRP